MQNLLCGQPLFSRPNFSYKLCNFPECLCYYQNVLYLQLHIFSYDYYDDVFTIQDNDADCYYFTIKMIIFACSLAYLTTYTYIICVLYTYLRMYMFRIFNFLQSNPSSFFTQIFLLGFAVVSFSIIIIVCISFSKSS